MLSFAPLEKLLISKKIPKTTLKTEKILNGSTYTFIVKAMKTPVKKGMSISAIDNICKALNCQPGDILEYIPD
ncbi:MAG: helix-turn-helix domain-containing protein [Eubacterium sp.]|nr:helix-turn-helix domain-containing protein [Eubacterium sp.]